MTERNARQMARPKEPKSFFSVVTTTAAVALLFLSSCSLPPELEAEYRRSIQGIEAQIDANEAVRRELLSAWQRGEVTEDQYLDRMEVIEAKDGRYREALEGVESAYKEAKANVTAAGIARVGEIAKTVGVIGGDLLGALSPLLLVFLPGIGPIVGALGGLLGRLKGAKDG